MRWRDSDLFHSFSKTPIAWVALAVASVCVLGAALRLGWRHTILLMQPVCTCRTRFCPRFG